MDEDDAIELGAEMKASRQAAGLTLAEVARAAGITEGRVRQLEKGYESRGEFRYPVRTRPQTLPAIARALGSHAGPLLRAAAGSVEPAAPLARGLTDDVLPLDGLDDATKAYLRTVAEEARRRNPAAQ